ncbi:hypothetical protein J5N97_010508 [Dioscorea zingiberensis]|uniref:NAC domain-containing protein n=1 Tax=Dioscorea zingiberensis TaxID=325984 RepID=A0A9D5D1B3_9LILI|nr:hypothetical protein J5N97_010508 [Dioscorea zingiberensis]
MAANTRASSSYFTLRRGGEEIHVPFGYRFQPSDEDLLLSYLLKRLLRLSLPADIIFDIDDVFSYNPNQLPKNEEVWMENTAYFFVPVLETNHNDDSSGLKVRTPDGYWRVCGDVVVVMDERRRIGFKKTLVFYQGHEPGMRTNWTMVEYKINMDLDELKDKEV